MKRQDGGYLGARPSWSTAASPGVWSLDQLLARRAAGTWPATSFLFDPYFESVSLLLHMNGSNGSTTFVDSSLGNLAVTANGNAQISTAQSKFGGASGAFDGTGDYLTIAGSSASGFDFGTGSFTIEAWVRLNTMPTSGYPGSFWIVGFGPLNSNPGFDFYLTSTNIVCNVADFSSPTASGVHGMTTNTWYHVAAVRSDTTVSVYVDGVLKGSGTTTASSPTVANGVAICAAEATGSTGGNLNGYIDELRVTRGVARYTANFTVPGNAGSDEGAALYDPYFDYVSLLLRCNGENNSTTFTDSSNNALTVTANGNAKISTDRARFGGASAYFDGTGDFAVSPDNDALEPGSANLTWEMWINTTSSSQYATLFSRTPASFGSAMWSLMINVASATAGDVGLYVGDYSGASPLLQTTGVSVRDGLWHHIAVVRNGSAWTLYVDGTSRATGTWAGTIAGSSASVYIGRDQFYTRDYLGYIDDLRITKGVARYTTAFRPVGPYATSGKLVDPYLTSTSLLLPMTGDNGTTSFFDRSNNFLRATENGNAKISTTISKFGAGAAYFDGAGDYIDLSTNSAVRGTEDFTIEAWIYPTSVTGSDRCLYETRGGAGFVLFVNTSGYLQVFDSVVGTASTASTTLLSANTWQHIALVGSGSTKAYFVNGSAAGTFTLSSLAGPTNLRIGARNDAAAAFVGYIDDLRVTRGAARYTTAFVPPERAFNDEAFNDPHYNAVSLLLHMDGANNSTTFSDSSVNGLTVTANGDAKISTAQSRFGGASAVFDGTGDYVSCTLPAIGTNDFTIEGWVYFNSFANYRMLYESRTADGDTSGFVFGANASGQLFVYLGSFVLTTGTLTLNAWQHVALTRSGGTWRIFINGVLQTGTYSNSGSLTRTSTRIGMDWATLYGMNGYIDEYRISIGVARYVTNFTPPTLPFYNTTVPTTDPSFSSVSLLLHMNGSNGSTTFTDSSSNALTVTANGNAQISTTQSKFGNSSGYFDGSGDTITTATSSLFNLSGDFTIEGYIYPTSFSAGNNVIFNLWSSASDKIVLATIGTSGVLYYLLNGNAVITTTASPSLNQWSHIALVRSFSTTTLYLNGSSIGTTTSSPASSSKLFEFGSDRGGAYYQGYADDLRITKGVARYTSNFYIPRAAFPDA